jgi:hypothetical protein
MLHVLSASCHDPFTISAKTQVRLTKVYEPRTESGKREVEDSGRLWKGRLSLFKYRQGFTSPALFLTQLLPFWFVPLETSRLKVFYNSF